MFFFKNSETDLTFKPRSVEFAYLAIVNDDLDTAESIFESIDSPRAKWGVSLVQILRGYIKKYPTYFEIRNFLEIDLDFLIKNEKINYVEMLLSSLKNLTNINQEIYKYAARVLYENKFYKASKEYMEKSKELFYKDPELHFMLAKFYLKDRDYENADLHIDECLKIIPDYYPAKNLKNKISSYFA